MEQWMVEAAMAELESLEADHPSRFDYLKLELRNFINLPSSASNRSISSGPAPTQASSTAARKRKVTFAEPEVVAGEGRRWLSRASRADLAMERAAECLRKIKKVKESLFADCC